MREYQTAESPVARVIAPNERDFTALGVLISVNTSRLPFAHPCPRVLLKKCLLNATKTCSLPWMEAHT